MNLDRRGSKNRPNIQLSSINAQSNDLRQSQINPRTSLKQHQSTSRTRQPPKQQQTLQQSSEFERAGIDHTTLMTASIDTNKNDATISYYGRREQKAPAESPLSQATTVQIRAKHVKRLRSPNEDTISDGADDMGPS